MQLKQSVIKTEHSQECQESLTGDYPALVHTVLWAHSPIYSLLCSFVYWCSHKWHWSWTQYSTDSLIHSLFIIQFCSYSLPSLCHPYCSMYTQHTDSLWHNCPSLAIHCPYIMLIACLELNNAVIAGYPQNVLSPRMVKFWRTGSLDIRGFVVYNTTRRSCHLLQFHIG